MTTSLREDTPRLTIDDVIFNIEDYVGGNIEGVETIDRMGFTVFLRSQLNNLIQQEADRQKLKLLDKLYNEAQPIVGKASGRNEERQELASIIFAERNKLQG